MRKTRAWQCLAMSVLSAILAGGNSQAQAANRWWDGGTGDIGTDGNGSSGGTAGNWNETLLNWDAGVAPHVAWNNGNNDTAIFGGTAGTVTLNTGITAGGLTLTTANYIITGNTLTLGGATPIIDNSGAATISSIISGSAGLTKSGAGALTLSNAGNNYTGGTVINAGTISFGANNDSYLGATSGGLTFNGTGNITFGDNFSLHANRTVSLNGSVTWGAAITVNGILTGSGTLSVNSADDFIFSNAANTYTGPITSATQASNGYGLKFNSIGDTAGAGLITLVGGSGTFHWMSASGSTTTLANRQFAISGTGSGMILARGTTAGSNLVISKDLLIPGPAGSRTLTLEGTNTGNNTFAGNIANGTAGGASVISLTKAGASLWILTGDNTYTGTTTISGGTLQIGNGGTTGSLSPSSSIANNATLTFKRSDNIAQGTHFATVISGTGAVIKDGAGDLTLSGANTFKGTTTVSAGKILMTNPLALQYSAYNTTGSNGSTIGLDVTSGLSSGTLTLGGLSGGVNLASAFTAGYAGSVINLTLNPQTGVTSTYSGAINDATTGMTVTKTGAGTQALSGNSSFSGGLNIQEGVIQYDQFSNANAFGAAGNVITFTGNATLHNNDGAYTLARAITINNGIIASMTGAFGESTTVTGVVSGSGTLKVEGYSAGWALTLNNTANTFTGPVVILPNANASLTVASLGSSANAITLSTGAGHVGTFTYTGSAALSRPFVMAGTTSGSTIAASGTGALTSSGFSVTGAGIKTLTLDGSGTAANEIADVIADNGGATSVTKAGGGMWILSGNNTFTGTLIIGQGTLSVGTINNYSAAGPLGQQVSSAVQLGSGANSGILQYTGAVGTPNRTFQIGDGTAANTGGGVVYNNGTGAITFSAANFNPTVAGITATRTLTLGGTYTAGANEISGIIRDNVSGTGKISVTKAADASIWKLSGLNTYTGTTTVSGGATPTTVGVLWLNNASALPGGIGSSGGTSALTINSYGVLGLGVGDFTRGLGTGVTQVQMTGSGGFAAYGADRIVNLGGAGAQVTWASGSFTSFTFVLGATSSDAMVDFRNPIALVNAAARTIQVDNGSAAIDAKLSGVISTSGSITKTGAGNLWLSNVNTYTGKTIINAGTVTIDAESGLGTAPGAFTADQLTLNGGTLATTATIAGFSANRGVTIGASGATFTPAASTSLTIDRVIAGSAGGALTKTGSGTLILGANNTYDGATAVQAGTLRINGNQSTATGAITVDSGATLEGTGTSGGALTLDGSVKPGTPSAVGTLTLAGATFNNGSSFVLDFSSSGVDSLILTGNATFDGGTHNISFNDIGGVPSGSSYVLLQASNTINPDSFTLSGAPPTGYTVQYVGSQLLLVQGTASDGTWTRNTGIGTWTDIANWNSGAGPYANGAGQTANFSTISLTGDVTVRLDSSKTIGNMTFDDVGDTYGWILDDNGSSGANILTLAGVTPTITVNSLGSGKLVEISAVLAGSTGLRKAGTDHLTLSGANTFSGGLTLNAGTVSVGADGNLGAAGNTVTFGGGGLRVTGGFADARTLALSSSGTIEVTGANTLTQSGSVTGGAGLTKVGTGTLTLSNGANTFSGGLNLNAGTVSVGADGNLGAAGNTVTFGGGGLRATGSFTDARTLALSSSGTIDVTVANTLNQSGNVTGGGGLTKVGIGTLTLSVANDFTGGLNVQAGTVKLGNDTAAGAGTVTLGVSGDATFGTLDLNGASRTIIGLATAGTAGNQIIGNSAGTAATLNYGGATTSTFGGVIQNGPGASTTALTVANAGAVLTLSGANTFSGNTRVGSGSLTVGNALALQSSTLDMNASDSGTLTFNQNSTLGGLTGSRDLDMSGYTLSIGNNNTSTAYSGELSNGGLTKTGSGTLTLSGNSSYSGTTVISGGILDISHANALGDTTGNTTIAATGASAGPRLTPSGNINSPENITLTGNTEQNQWAGVIYNTSGINTLSGNITLANPAGNIRLLSSGGELILAGTISQTTSTKNLILQAGTGAAIAVNNGIANNNGALVILGYATGGASAGVTLKAASTAIGDVSILENGLIKLGVTDALKTTATLTLGTTGSNTGYDIGTFDLAGFNQTVNALVGTKNTGGVIAPDASRKVTNSGAGTGANTLTVGNGNGTGVFNGVIVDGATAKVALTKIGTGTETLMGASTYSGVTTINGGTLVVGHNNALGNTTGTTTVMGIGGSSATVWLDLATGITVTGETLTLDTTGGRAALVVNTGTGTWAGNVVVTGGGAFAQLSAPGTLTVSGNISGDNSPSLFVVRGTGGTGTLSGNINIGSTDLVKTDTGTWTINTTGNSWGNTTVAHGTLRLGVTDALPTTTVLTMGQSTTGGTLDLNGKNQTIAGLTENAAVFVKTITSSTAATLTVNNSSDYSYGASSGIIAGSVALVKDGAGMLTLSGVNTYTGVTTINNGTLSVSSNSCLGAVATGAQVNLGGGTLRLNGTFTLDNSGSSKRNVSLTADSTIGVTAANTATISGEISGSGYGFTKSDAGTLTLTGANTYTGATAVDNGTLRINGNQSSATGAVNVNSGGTLGGTGTSGGALTAANGGTVNPGTVGTVGTLTAASGQFDSGSTFRVDVGSGANNADKLTLNGSSTITSGALISFNALGTLDQASYTLINLTSGTLTGTFTLSGGIPDGYTLSYTGTQLLLLQPTNTDGVWTSLATGVWSGTGNWSGGTVANGSGQTADFNTIDITSDVAVSLDSTRTIGNLTFGDTGAGSEAGWTLDNNGNGANILTISGATPTITVNALGGSEDVTISAVLTGSTDITKAGPGKLVLSAVNTYNAKTIVTGGTLSIGADSRLGAAPGGFTADRLQLNGGTLETTATFTLNANRGITLGAGGGTLSPTTGTLTINGIAITGGALTKTGAGTLILTGANTHTGGTSVDAGVLSFSNGALGTTGNITMNGGTLLWNGHSTDISARLNMVNGQTAYLDTGANNVTLATGFGGGTSGVLSKSGSGRLTLSGSNTYSGGTVISGGQLNITADSNLGGLSGDITFNGTVTLRMDATGFIMNAGRTINVNGGAVVTFSSNNDGKTFQGVLQGSGDIIGADSTGYHFTNTGNTFTGTVNNGYQMVFASVGDSSNPFNLVGSNSQFIWTGGAKSFALRVLTLNAAGTGNFINNGSGAVTFAADSAVTGTAGARTLSLSGSYSGISSFNGRIVDGSGSVVSLSIGGTWALNGASTYTGTTAIQGTVYANTIRDFGLASSFGAAASGVIQFGQYSASTIYYTGAGDTANRTINFFSDVSNPNGQIGIRNNGTGALIFDGATLNTQTDTAPDQTITLTLGGTYTGSANEVQGIIQNHGTGAGDRLALTKADASTWKLSGANTYSGATTISGGKLIGMAGGSCSNSAVTVNNTAGCVLGVRVDDNTKQWTCASLTSAGASAALAFGFTATPSTTVAPLRVINNVTFTGIPGITLDAANLTAGTYPLLVAGGTVPVGVPTVTIVGAKGTLAAIASWGGTGNKTLSVNITGTSYEPLTWHASGSGTWDINTTTAWKDNNGAPAKTYQETIVGDQVQFIDSGVSADTTVTLNNVVNPGGFTANNSTYNFTIGGSGSINGGTGLTKSGTKTLALSTPNAYTGNTAINGGILNAGTAESAGSRGPFGKQLATAAGTLLFGGGTLQYSAANQYDYSGRFSTAGSQPVSIDVNGQTVTFATAIQGSGTSLTLTDATGSGKLIFSVANTYTGATTLNGGTLQLGANNVIPDGASNGNVVFSPASGTATLDVNGKTETINGLSSSGAGSSVVDNTTGSGLLTVGGNDATSTFGGVIQNTGGTLALTKIGEGTLTLSGVNTYTGATTINAGTNLINGSLAGGSAVSVAGGTLGGTGTIGGSVTVAAAGSVAPGAGGAGTLSIAGGLDVSLMASGGSGKLRFDLAALAGTSDKIAVVTGTLTIGTNLLGLDDFVFTDIGMEPGTYILITSSDTPGSPDTSLGTVGDFENVRLRKSGNNIELVVPEQEPQPSVFRFR